MDPNDIDDQKKDKDQESPEGRANDLYNDGKNLNKGRNLLKGGGAGGEGAGGAEGAGAAAEGAGAAAEGLGAAGAGEAAVAGGGTVVVGASTTPIWVTVGAFLLLILGIVIIFIIVFGGAKVNGVGNSPVCTGITIDPASAGISDNVPAILSVTGCPADVTYSWDANDSNLGQFTSSSKATTVYIPQRITSGTKTITATVSVCSAEFADACTEYKQILTVKPNAAANSCTGMCLPADNSACVTNSTIGKGTCPAGMTPGRSCCEKPTVSGNAFACTSGDFATCLKSTFNVAVRGGSAGDLRDVFNIFAYASKSPGYLAALTNGGTLTIYLNDADILRCAGYTPSGNAIELGSCNASYNAKRYLLIHESGHAIAKKNPRLFQSYPSSTLRSQDASCYSSDGFLISYPLRYVCQGKSYSITARNESFAESIADYAVYQSYNPSGVLCAVPLTNFPTKCDNTYKWFNENFFQGYDY